jgi:hypothetical protein
LHTRRKLAFGAVKARKKNWARPTAEFFFWEVDVKIVLATVHVKVTLDALVPWLWEGPAPN